MGRILGQNEFGKKLQQFVKAEDNPRKPAIWGTCSGLIILANSLENQKTGGQYQVSFFPQFFVVYFWEVNEQEKCERLHRSKFSCNVLVVCLQEMRFQEICRQSVDQSKSPVFLFCCCCCCWFLFVCLFSFLLIYICC